MSEASAFCSQGEAWSPEVITVFLNVWTYPNIQARRAARKRCRAIYRMMSRLSHNECIQKSWSECRDMMVALENLHWTCQESNQNGQSHPIHYHSRLPLERVFSFRAGHGGSEHEESDVESIDLDTSEGVWLETVPAWTLPWHAAVQYEFILWNGASIAQVRNVQMIENSSLEPPLVILATFTRIPT